MTFSYDVTTTAGKMRLMLGDITSSTANFQDEELQAILDITMFQLSGPSAFFGEGNIPENEILFLACASAMDALAARIAGSPNGQTVTIGDFDLTGKDQVKAIQDVANRFRDAISNMPAWGITEENSCGFNELVIIRNWVLRTEL